MTGYIVHCLIMFESDNLVDLYQGYCIHNLKMSSAGRHIFKKKVEDIGMLITIVTTVL